MELYLLRHGIAADSGPAGSGDAGRPLTDEGRARMELAARGLRRIEVVPDALVSSPLVRAYQTAEIVAHTLNLEVQVNAAVGPGCDLRRLLKLLEAHRNARQVMIVGHEPDFSALVSDLTGGSHVLMKKGGLARVDLPFAGADHGTLVWLMTSRVLRELGAA